MGAAVKDDQPFFGFDNQALLMGKIIRAAILAADSIQIVAQRYGRVIRFAMRNKPEAVRNLIDSVDILNTRFMLLQDAALDADVVQSAVLDAKAVFTGAFPHQNEKKVSMPSA